jgi:hypothetical protein
MRNETAKRLAYWRELLDSIRSELTPKSAKRKFESLSRQRTPYLDKAANYFDLKVSRRTDAAILVRILASVIFDSREKNRPAGSKKWDEVRLFQLFIHHKLIEREKPSISDSRAAEEIKNRFPGHYQRDEPATIRQRILAARALANKRRFLDDWFLLALKQLTEGIEDKPGSQSAQQFRASADRCLKVMEGILLAGVGRVSKAATRGGVGRDRRAVVRYAKRGGIRSVAEGGQRWGINQTL